MKQKPFIMRVFSVSTAALLLGASLAVAQVPDRTITTYDSSLDGSAVWYGSDTVSWDSTQDANGNGGGSLYVQTTYGGSDTPAAFYITLPGDNYWWTGGGTFNFSDYVNLQFDIKWDPSSVVTLDQWNAPTNFPLADLSSSVVGMEIYTANGSGGGAYLTNIDIPTAAALGWVHITIPIDPAVSGIDPGVGMYIHKWLNNSGALAGLTNSSGVYTNTANFWIDNVTLKGTAAPPPPPTLHTLATAVQGLNVYAASAGNSFYDRQEVMTLSTMNPAWIGNATIANPVTYSFTITNFPTDPATYECEAYLFMSPYPGYNPAAPDWNDTNCAIAFMQVDSNGAVLHFQYKVDDEQDNMMYSTNNNAGANFYTNAPGSWDGVTPNYFETGDLGSVTNPSPLGTWTIQFTSDTNVTLVAPNGGSSSLVIPPYNIAKLGPTGNGYNGFNLFLGFQANNQASMNKAAVYSSFAVTGVPGAFSEDFMTESTLDTNIWDNTMSGNPAGVRIVPSDAMYWASWTLPDAGFSLQSSSNLLDSVWMSPAGPVVGMVNQRAQLLSSSDLPAGNTAFVRLLKRTYSQLQVLWPGETNAPDTATGKIGTPDPISLSGPDLGIVPVTINAVDSTYHIVNVTGDIITATVSDPLGIWNGDVPLTAGTAQQYVAFSTTGNWTVTASDLTNTNIPPATSSEVTVGP